MLTTEQPTDVLRTPEPPGPETATMPTDADYDQNPADERINILIVDDEPKNLTVLETLLDDPSYRLVRAQSADQALLALIDNDFALLILDVNMPDMTGFELAQLVKSRKKTAQVPIIFLTAYYNDDQHVMEGYGAGAVDYLHKPINPRVLRSKVAIFAELHRKNRENELANRALVAEVAERARIAEQLRELTVDLDKRVREQTAALRRREAELQSITDNVPDIIARFDRGFRHVFVNAAVTRVTGLVPEAYLGRTNRDLKMPEELCTLWETAMREVFTTGQRQEVRFSIKFAGGDRFFESTYLPEAGPDGAIDHVLAVTRDVTTATRAAEELARARDAAEAASLAKDQFLAVLSHELRTPLTPVRMALSMWELNPEVLPNDMRRDLAMIRRNIDLECRLIDDMLDLNRITHGKLELQFRSVDLHEEIRHAVSTVRGDAVAKQIGLTFAPDAERFEVIADAARIQQVLWNLLKNAVKFTPVGGSVTVRSRNLDDGRIRVEVCDNGTGIEPTMLTDIFNAFQQGGSEVTRQFGGLGLGLAISRALTNMHGGTLTASSEGRGCGATFTLDLALAQARPPNGQDGRARPASGLSGPSDGRILRILLVEDHDDSARLMVRLLAATGHNVDVAGSVAAAKAAYDATAYDLIISDLGLPDGTGNDLMTHVMASRPVKAIALSGYGMDNDVRTASQSGFAVHLTKPVSYEQLTEAVSRVTAS